MEDDLKNKIKKRKMNQSTKINLIGCDTNVNSPSINFHFINHWGEILMHLDALFLYFQYEVPDVNSF
jgi:hypothetical protein